MNLASYLPPGATSRRAPRTRLTFRVGVVGHRAGALVVTEELRSVVHEVLLRVCAEVKQVARQHASLFDGAPPALRVVSSLADGTDQLVADEALVLGFDLICPRPFVTGAATGADEEAVDEFLERARRRYPNAKLVEFAVDGESVTQARREQTYVAAAQVMLNQSDIVIGIWDGKPARGLGGTAETIEKALVNDLRVIWIHAHAKAPARVLTGKLQAPHDQEGEFVPSEMTDLDGLAAVVAEVLGLPSRESERRADELAAYYAERPPRLRLAILWRIFRSLLGPDRWSMSSLRPPKLDGPPTDEWSPASREPIGWVNQQLFEHYRYADTLSKLNADAYRSSFIALYMLSALAGLLALLPLVFGWHEAAAKVALLVCRFGETATVSLIIWIVVWGRRREWHRRWLDYRVVAELVRQLRLQIPLGGARLTPRVASYLGISAGYGNPADTWMYWHVRAIEREVGLPDVRALNDSVRQCIEELRALLKSQIGFHEASAGRAAQIEKRLHFAGLALFASTAAMVAYEFVELAMRFASERTAHAPAMHHDSHGSLLTLLGAFLPAAGAALAAIAGQGEYARIARRSEGMSQALQSVLTKVERRLDLEPIALRDAVELVRMASQPMVDEVLDWRVLLIDRPLVPPA